MPLLDDLLVLRQLSLYFFGNAGKYFHRNAVPLFKDTVLHLSPSPVLHLVGESKTVPFRENLADVLNAAHRLSPGAVLRFQHRIAVDPVKVRIPLLMYRIIAGNAFGLHYFDDRVILEIDQINAAVVVQKRLQ